MVKHLKELKLDKEGRYLAKPGGKAQNPFLGQKMKSPYQKQKLATLKVHAQIPGTEFWSKEGKTTVKYATPGAKAFPAIKESVTHLPLRVRHVQSGPAAALFGTEVQIGPVFRHLADDSKRDVLLRQVLQWYLGTKGIEPNERALDDAVMFFTDPQAIEQEDKVKMTALATMMRGYENRIREWVQNALTLREDDVGYTQDDDHLDRAVRRAGFDDVEQARAAAQNNRDQKRLAKLPPRVRKHLIPKQKKKPKRPLTDRVDEAFRFDSLPYSSMRLRDVIRLLEAAVDIEPMDKTLVKNLLERIMGALEFMYLSVSGRPAGNIFSRRLYKIVDKLLTKNLGESAERLRDALTTCTG